MDTRKVQYMPAGLLAGYVSWSTKCEASDPDPDSPASHVTGNNPGVPVPSMDVLLSVFGESSVILCLLITQLVQTDFKFPLTPSLWFSRAISTREHGTAVTQLTDIVPVIPEEARRRACVQERCKRRAARAKNTGNPVQMRARDVVLWGRSAFNSESLRTQSTSLKRN